MSNVCYESFERWSSCCAASMGDSGVNTSDRASMAILYRDPSGLICEVALGFPKTCWGSKV
jgi:hypothetical protein